MRKISYITNSIFFNNDLNIIENSIITFISFKKFFNDVFIIKLLNDQYFFEIENKNEIKILKKTLMKTKSLLFNHRKRLIKKKKLKK